MSIRAIKDVLLQKLQNASCLMAIGSAGLYLFEGKDQMSDSMWKTSGTQETVLEHQDGLFTTRNRYNVRQQFLAGFWTS
uniref:AlNc14C286G10179 protein n=1 Tax=Albugo laibachii Nc14 TaxID=890382 RepID=F0WV36_9STRA|nr:AlNc14C286G10179 [Albugo laibachii Nc14]|eukprot:CCA25273.1 AlNc14C286G10179 [Albugo laibachii Nc14]